MNVLILAQYFPPDMGGGATRAYNMAKGLSKVGCKVTVVSAFPHYPDGNIPKNYSKKIISLEKTRNLRVVRTFVPPLASKGFTNRILLFASFGITSLFAIPIIGKVDIIWAANPNVIAVFPSLLYRIIKRCRIVQNVDDLWPEALYDLGFNSRSWFAKISEFVAKIAYNISSGLTPISPAYVDILSNKYKIASSKISVIAAGVDSNIFNKNLGFHGKKERYRVLYIGAFSPAYDFDQVIESAKILASHNVDFVIQGGGELAVELKSKVKKSDLNNVYVIQKIVSRKKVAEIMLNSDFLLLPLNGIGSIEMGISSKLYEYQAAGKPILCCSCGEPGKYVLKSNSGLVVKPGDYGTLAKSIIKLIENPDLARMLGENGREYVEREISIGTIGLKMKKFFEIINSR